MCIMLNLAKGIGRNQGADEELQMPDTSPMDQQALWFSDKLKFAYNRVCKFKTSLVPEVLGHMAIRNR
jgi:hypothetical protein